MTNREQRAREVLRQHAKSLTAFGEANVIRAMLAFAEVERSAQSEEPWAWGWYERGGEKRAYGYLPTVDYPRDPECDPFPLYRHPAPQQSAPAIPALEKGSTIYDSEAHRRAVFALSAGWPRSLAGVSDGELLVMVRTVEKELSKDTPKQQSAPASDVLREVLDDLQKAEAAYRKAHDLHGDGDRYTGRMWDLMRRAGDKARATLSQPSAPSQGEEREG